MKKVADYTVLEIINLYKGIIGTDIGEVLSTAFFENDKQKNVFKKGIENAIVECGQIERRNKG